MKKVDISVVICTYNRAELLHRALESIVRQKTDSKFTYEIVVIDDGSTDCTSNIVKRVATSSKVPVRYFYQKGDSIADARNRGIAEAHGKWIAWFDDDQWTESDWLMNLHAVALKMSTDCVGGILKLDLPKFKYNDLGPVCRSILGEYTWHEKPGKCKSAKVPSTGNILISRKIIDSVGLFDTSMIYGSEDTDFLLRIRTAGFSIWIAPGAVVHHLIPTYRLKPAYFRWVCLRKGSNIPLLDRKRAGSGMTLLFCIARIAQALLINMPNLFIAYMKRNRSEILDCKCLLWRAAGYLRKTLHLFVPRIFSQKRFFSLVEFRRERKYIRKFGKSQRKPNIKRLK